MPPAHALIIGEFARSLDDRYRLSIPPELAQSLVGEASDCTLAKERPGCLSLWNATSWQTKHDQDVALLEGKLQAGRLEGRQEQVQQLGRLLSTRHRRIQLAGRGRLVLPEGFREFLGVEPGAEVMVVGAAVCVEIWNPTHWIAYLEQRIPDYRGLMETLAD
jgi:MraZ protein